MKVVILAAGKGTRMLPLTKTLPKVLIPINNAPFLKLLITNLQKAGLEDIGIVVNYKKEKIGEFLGENNIKATLINQQDTLGTGSAVLSAKSFVGDDPFVVCGGDNLWHEEDIKELISSSQNAIAAIKVEDPSRYGVLQVKDDRLVGVIEKPKEFVGDLINSGLYKFTPEVFSLLESTPLSARGEYELTDVLTKLNMQVIPIKKYWLDLGKPEDIRVIEEFLKEKNN